MSNRWYPLYQRGSPQLRVFLPNFWLKLVRPEHKQPENVVTFEVSMEMVILIKLTDSPYQQLISIIFRLNTILKTTLRISTRSQ
jgi:hypothetical protein